MLIPIREAVLNIGVLRMGAGFYCLDHLIMTRPSSGASFHYHAPRDLSILALSPSMASLFPQPLKSHLTFPLNLLPLWRVLPVLRPSQLSCSNEEFARLRLFPAYPHLTSLIWLLPFQFPASSRPAVAIRHTIVGPYLAWALCPDLLLLEAFPPPSVSFPTTQTKPPPHVPLQGTADSSVSAAL